MELRGIAGVLLIGFSISWMVVLSLLMRSPHYLYIGEDIAWVRILELFICVVGIVVGVLLIYKFVQSTKEGT